MDSKEQILEGLIKACINSNPIYFKKFLMSNLVTTNFLNKEKFYQFFKFMILRSKEISFGQLYLQIVPNSQNNNEQYYKFYDSHHLHSRLTIVVCESSNLITLDIMPF